MEQTSKRSAMSKSDDLISVIIPIMNVEESLDQCLMSVRAQTYPHLEILCLNDGSTDKSLAIIEKHAREDSRIRVIDKPNEGYGATCNRGLDAAQGRWVSIIEPDDWVDAALYERMISFAQSFETPLDIVKTPWYDVVHNTERICYLDGRLNTSTSPFVLEDAPILIEGHPAIWSALYSKRFLDENHIRFVPYPGAGWADNPFLIETMGQAENIVYLAEPFYHYRRDTSAGTTDAAKEMPFTRWQEMTCILERLDKTDRSVQEAHVFRGFKYLQAALDAYGSDDPVVNRASAMMFETMDADIVLQHPKLSPHQKRAFAVSRGIRDVHISHSSYLKHVMHEGVNRIKHRGIKELTNQVKERIRPASHEKCDS